MNNSANVAMPTVEDGEIQEMQTNQVSAQQIWKKPGADPGEGDRPPQNLRK